MKKGIISQKLNSTYCEFSRHASSCCAGWYELLHTAFAAAFLSVVSRSPFDFPLAGTTALVWQILVANTNEGWFIHKTFLSEELDCNSALVLHCLNCPDGKEGAPQNMVASSHISPWGEIFLLSCPAFGSMWGTVTAESINQLRKDWGFLPSWPWYIPDQ